MVLVEFDLNQNDAEALLRHCRSYVPSTDDARENRRLMDALQALAQAIEASAGVAASSSSY